MTIEHSPEGRYLLDFDTRGLPGRSTDVLVIGGGVAGLSAALSAADRARVLIIEKDHAGVCNTASAQGGIAAAVARDDTPALHAADTIRTGFGLADEALVESVTRAAPGTIEWLEAHGARFERNADGFSLGQEGGHRCRRILHRGDATGREISRALTEAVGSHAAIQRESRLFVVDLLTAGGRCVGALVLERDGGLAAIFARTVVLAAGGAGRLWRETSNVRGATGDGVAAAFRAGARLRDVEFVQFHPTTLYLAGSDRVLVTEAVRGEGAHLVDNEDRRFLEGLHPSAELAPRDFVSRAIVDHLAKPGVTGVFLDLRHWPPHLAAQRFPELTAVCGRYGLDPAHDPIPVRPAAHYYIGGVACDAEGATNVRGLRACGEAACSGMHGANRLASNSLLEGLVLGMRVGNAAAAGAAGAAGADGDVVIRHATGRKTPESVFDVLDLRRSLTSVMWRNAGVIRDGAGLADAAASVHQWREFFDRVRLAQRPSLELANMLLLGELVIAASRRRKESRGTHSRIDFPQTDDERFRGSFLWRAGDEPEFRRAEVTSLG